MAEHGAHLTATEQEKPSIFEVVACDSLHSTFHPAIKRLCNVLAAINPDKFGWTIRFYDELFLLLNAGVQQYYVRRFGGSLSEVFYGLTRVSWAAAATTQTHSSSLTRRSMALAFASLVLLPYIRTKLDGIAERYKDELHEYSPVPESTIFTRTFKRRAIQIYSTVISIYEGLQLVQYIAYMANRSDSHSLLLRFIRMNLAYLPPEQGIEDWSWTDLMSGKIRHSALLSTIAFRGLELSAFFLQFVQWWQTEANQGSLMNLPVPEAPDFDANSNKYTGICPICVQSWEIPTAVSISGYVYCYKCIMKHFQTQRTCPMTNYPADLDDLIRIFEV